MFVHTLHSNSLFDFEPFFGLPERKPDEPSQGDEEMEDQDANGDTAMEDKDSEEGKEKKSDDMNVDSGEEGNSKEGADKDKEAAKEEDEEAQTDDSKEEESEPAALDFGKCKPLAAHLKESSKGKSGKAKSVF